jgi:catechol 2,3-dioxygenase-like lactoylglutathione lyase family enzyme
MDTKLEVVVLPVSDVERATKFYKGLGWRQDVTPPGSGVVQLTPPGSGCSVHFGTNLTTAAPGSSKCYLIVSDVEAARKELVAAGAPVSEFFHLGAKGPAGGLDPERRSYFSLASFNDPDGNAWILQEIQTRLPGRGFSTLDVQSLTELLKETEEHHGAYERTAPKHHWSGWYAAYMVARQGGATPEDAAKDAAKHMHST